MTARRLDAGGLVERDRPVPFTLQGQSLTGLAGDTAASAALAAGVLRVGDSIYRRRPRGIATCGVEEPNAFVRVGGPHPESMLPATTLELLPGMDLTWEDGIGELAQTRDDAEYDHRHVHTDVAVVGSGPAGLAAARAAAATGVRVMLLEQDHALGGSLLASPDEQVEGLPARDWVARVEAGLREAGARVLARTGVVGSYDNNHLVALERRDHREPRPGRSRQRVWHVTAGRVVLATGAFERPVLFAGNDRPGVMQASAVRTYLGRYGVLAGERAVVLTVDDSAYPVAAALAEAGSRVDLVDVRDRAGAADPPGVTVHRGLAVVQTLGEDVLTGVLLGRPGDRGSAPVELDCDLLAVCGGWSPNVALHGQRQGALAWDDDLAAFVPTGPVAGQALAGAVTGTWWTAGCLAEGAAAGAGELSPVTAAQRTEHAGRPEPVWLVPAPDGRLDTHVVDPQRDATAADVVRSVGAGMRSVEHVKRYTSISTGLDQGKVGGVLTIGLLATLLEPGDLAGMPAGQPGQDAGGGAEDASTQGGHATTASPAPSPGAIGTTTFRAPFTPVAFAALAGRARGELYDPARRTPAHDRHVEAGAPFEDVGQWKRPWYYPADGEDLDAAVARECRAARTGVACMDASTLGKIEIRGADAGEMLNRMYTNAFAQLPVGRQRYGVMCRPDGMVLDDGVSFRLSDDRFLTTTTTGGAATVLDRLEEWAQTEWPELDVWFTSVTEQWATVAVVGPRAREVMAVLAPDLDVSQEGFAFMAHRDTVLASGICARVARVTFSGELAFEVNVAGWYGEALWDDVLAAGEPIGITPYGTETMHVLRAEKAYPIVGQDTDGTVTPHDLGLGWAVSTKKDFVGRRSYERAGYAEAGRKHLVSLLPVDPDLRLPEGSQVVAADDAPAGGLDGLRGLPQRPVPMIGHVTSGYRSEALGRTFALALVRDGRSRIGEQVLASFGGRLEPAVIGAPCVYDEEGARRDG